MQSDLPPAIRAIDRDKIRSGRKREVRAITLSAKRATLTELALLRAENAHYADLPRLPKTRGECIDGPRPCPFVSCSHHLFLDVAPRTGSMKLNFPDLEPDQLEETCALDVADRGGETLEKVAQYTNIVRERVRQVEHVALVKMAMGAGPLAEYADGDRTAVRAHQEDE